MFGSPQRVFTGKIATQKQRELI